MGYRFEAKHADIVAYITSHNAGRTPRLTGDELCEFLGSLAYQYGEPPLISSFPDWIEQVKKAADAGLKFVESRRFDRGEQLTPETIDRALFGVRSLMSDYNLFGLATGAGYENRELRRFAEYAALSSGHHAIFLMPEYSGQEPLSFLDPFPAIAILVERPNSWPGVLFWSRSGSAAFASLREMNELYSRLQQELDNLHAINTILEKYQTQSAGKKILHLSDVHFGTEAELENEAYLSAHLQSIANAPQNRKRSVTAARNPAASAILK